MKRMIVGVLSILLSACAITIQHTPTELEKFMAAHTHLDSTYTPTEGDQRIFSYTELKERIRGWGYTITDDVPLNSGLYGFNRFHEKWIAIESTLPVNAKMEVLAHEACHTFQPSTWGVYSVDSPTGRVKLGPYGKTEMFAELCAQRVMSHYGFGEYTEVSRKYLLAFKDEVGVERLMGKDIEMAYEHVVGIRSAPVFPKQEG